MPFQKKEKAPESDNAGTGATPGTPGNVPVTTEKEKKENKSNVAAEVKVKRELYEKNKELEEKNKVIEELRKEVEFAKNQPKPESTQAPDSDMITQLQAQINQLSSQVLQSAQGKKLLFRQPTAADLQEESIVFTARSIIYIVASYTDARGLEQLPPHKLIVFNYAASDIKKDGREEEIKNFSQYTTNLKTEIEFLRNHPFYGVAFSENTNEMMDEDVKQLEFRTRAALQLSIMAPEDILNRARELGIPNWQKKSASELKFVILNKMAEIYKKEAQELQDDIIRRRALAQMTSQNQNKE